MPIVYIALGSNLEQPTNQLQQALHTLDTLPEVELIAVSAFYQSTPLGPQDQPDYINAVACLNTELSPIELLDLLQKIENIQGRKRLQRWGARTLDLDILLYGQQTIHSERLIVPHYDMENREFVILPLLEIAPDLTLPNGKQIKDFAVQFFPTTMCKLSKYDKNV